MLLSVIHKQVLSTEHVQQRNQKGSCFTCIRMSENEGTFVSACFN